MCARSQSDVQPFSSERLIADLQTADAYPHPLNGPVVMHETHVSWVMLAGDFAYKIKKPIQTGFLDYSTLQRRHQFCHDEIRLDQRYTEDLYLGVVPIDLVDGRARVEGDGPAIEYAVKMRRFPDDALLSQRLDLGLLTAGEVRQLADAIATFHDRADRWNQPDRFASPSMVAKDLQDCLDDLAQSVVAEQTASSRSRLQEWAERFMSQHRSAFEDRVTGGFIRECHGDLHLDNVIELGDRLMPFDGIEFNDSFRWIDVLNDAAFLVMDFAARGHSEFGRIFLSAYLEHTGDYESLALMRWYLVYRALVRAKVAAIRAAQETGHELEPRQDCLDHVALAEQFAHPPPATLWITHGLSGSGKTTASEPMVCRHGAIRLRSDLERKRMFHLAPTERAGEEIYSAEATEKTYDRLRVLARSALEGGFSVIVDATFLKRSHRDAFRQLAEQLNVKWGIVNCHAEVDVLRQRVKQRLADGHDASDADLQVLEKQIAEQEPLTPEELDDV